MRSAWSDGVSFMPTLTKRSKEGMRTRSLNDGSSSSLRAFGAAVKASTTARDLLTPRDSFVNTPIAVSDNRIPTKIAAIPATNAIVAGDILDLHLDHLRHPEDADTHHQPHGSDQDPTDRLLRTTGSGSPG